MTRRFPLVRSQAAAQRHLNRCQEYNRQQVPDFSPLRNSGGQVYSPAPHQQTNTKDPPCSYALCSCPLPDRSMVRPCPDAPNHFSTTHPPCRHGPTAGRPVATREKRSTGSRQFFILRRRATRPASPEPSSHTAPGIGTGLLLA